MRILGHEFENPWARVPRTAGSFQQHNRQEVGEADDQAGTNEAVELRILYLLPEETQPYAVRLPEFALLHPPLSRHHQSCHCHLYDR
jgi:hypothetical protein